MTNNRFPPVEIELPSRGWFYEESNPLSSGKISLHLPTAREEDILVNAAYINKKIVLDKFLEAIIATPNVKYDSILTGDKDAILIAARILSYGKNYPAQVICSVCGKMNSIDINLETLEPKKIEFPIDKKYKNIFNFILPKSGVSITFKLLTHDDEKNIKQTLDGYAKRSDGVVPQITTLMKRSIVSIDGKDDKKYINDFVDNMLVADSRAFRKYASEIAPGISWEYVFTCSDINCKNETRLEVPVDETFFWPQQ